MDQEQAPRRRGGRRWLAAVVVLVVVAVASCDFQGTWAAPVALPLPAGATAGDDFSAVSCPPGSGACVAAGRIAARRSGGTWSALPAPPVPITTLACAAADDCLGAPTGSSSVANGAVYHFDGATWAPTNWPSAFAPSSISCPSATTCLAVGRNLSGSTAQRWNGSTFTATTLPAPSVQTTGVSCSSTTFCLAVGGAGGGAWAARWNGTSWATVTTASLTTSLDRVSCQSATSCHASAQPSAAFQLATWNGTTLTGGPTEPFQDFLTGWHRFTCGSGSPVRCFGVRSNSEDGSDVIVGLVTPSPQQGMSHLPAISCASSTDCLAVGTTLGGSRAAWHFDGTAWSPDPIDLPVSGDAVVADVSCSSATSCLAIGTYAHGTSRRPYALVGNGSTWSPTPQPLPFTNAEQVGTVGTGVSCVSPTFCGVVVRERDERGEFPVSTSTLYAWNGTTWTPQAGEAPVDLACFSPTSCVGLDHSASYAWNGTTVTRTPLPTPVGGNLRSFSCASPTRCVEVLDHAPDTLVANAVVTWDGTTAVKATAPAPPGQVATIEDVSCVPGLPTRCVLVGASGPHLGTITADGSPFVLTGDGTGTWTAPALPAAGPGSLRHVSCPNTAECLATGSGSVEGTAHAGLVLAMAIDTWLVAPALPTVSGAPWRVDDFGCGSGWCVATGGTGAVGAREAMAATYAWTY